MSATYIQLTCIENVKHFVAITNRYTFRINLISDKYIIDAKSIMGVFSLDLSQPLVMQVEEDDHPLFKTFMEEIGAFLV